MRQIKWSQDKAGTLNGKVGHVTLFTVAYYQERGYFVAPKLPGLKTIPVNSEKAGKKEAEALYKRYFDFLNWTEWNLELNYQEPTSLGVDCWNKPHHHFKGA